MSNKPRDNARPARARSARVRAHPSGPVASRPVAAANGATLDLGPLPDLIGYQLRLVQRAIFADFAEGMGEHGLSPGLFGILVIIEANPGLKQSSLALAAHLDRSSIVPVVDKLEARALVERRATPDDRRANGLWLTATGSTLLRDAKRRVQRHEQRVARNLSAAERSQLIALLQRILPEKR